MRQVFARRGAVTVEDVPVPLCGPDGVLVQTAWSVLNAGTERTDISRQRVAERLRHQPDVVRKVWRELKRSGPSETVRLVRNKVERPVPLGNSLAGVVVEVGAGAHEFRVGDRVACGGTEHAYHAEHVFVPRVLAVQVPDGLALKDAAFANLGAIALQGVRRAGLQLGETAVVVGLGLIGLLTVQILKAAGVRVIGVDPVKERVSLAERLGAERGLDVGTGDSVTAVLARTGGHGADAVLLTAGTASSDPVNHAFEMARERGRVVVVGDVGLNLSRPTFYRKELDLVISRSTGPGRYDRKYEERGIDYPLGHVRWTEQRNLDAFVQLLARGVVRVADLIAGEYPVEDASRAYAALAATGRGVALLIRYAPEQTAPISRTVRLTRPARDTRGATRVALIGAGAFARQTLLPLLVKHPDVSLRAIVGGSSGAGLQEARRYGADVYTTDPRQVLDDPAVDAVVIATRHHLHAPLALEAVRRGKAVFVEKPLALTEEACRTVARAVADSDALLTVGFNRRYSPLARAARDALAGTAGPAMAVYRVNAGPLPADHWLLDPEEGGGRIVGEACHFFDFLCWLLGEEPASVHATAPAGLNGPPQELAATLRFSGGSVGTILYAASGHSAVPKERVEVFKGGRSVVLDDFRHLSVDGSKSRAWADAKGYEAEIAGFLQAVRGEASLGVTVMDGLRATLLCLRALASATAGVSVAAGVAGLGVAAPEPR